MAGFGFHRIIPFQVAGKKPRKWEPLGIWSPLAAGHEVCRREWLASRANCCAAQVTPVVGSAKRGQTDGVCLPQISSHLPTVPVPKEILVP